jgi:hypothetical protein
MTSDVESRLRTETPREVSRCGTVPNVSSSRRNHRSRRTCSHAKRSHGSHGNHNLYSREQRQPVARRCEGFRYRRHGTWRD